MSSKTDRSRIERVARMYNSNKEASAALGIASGSFSRLCKRFEIETPYARRLRIVRECRSK